MEKKIITVNPDIVADIQLKDASRQTALDIVSNLLDLHRLDTDLSFMDQPVYKRLSADADAKKLEWDKAKDAMIQKVIPKDEIDRIKDWSLDYMTGRLSYVLA